jgi:hypothetical protein
MPKKIQRAHAALRLPAAALRPLTRSARPLPLRFAAPSEETLKGGFKQARSWLHAWRVCSAALTRCSGPTAAAEHRDGGRGAGEGEARQRQGAAACVRADVRCGLR